jgi:hypothetical protein
MFRLTTAALLIAALAGCASTQPPSCDGTDRRPVNAPQQVGVTYLSCGATA